MGIQIRSYLYLIYLKIQIGLIILIVFIFHFPILCYTGHTYLQLHCNQLFSLYSSLSYSYINSHNNIPNYETKEGGRFWNTQKVYFSVRITNGKKLYSSTFCFFYVCSMLKKKFYWCKGFFVIYLRLMFDCYLKLLTSLFFYFYELLALFLLRYV